jgi:hypothetical protein
MDGAALLVAEAARPMPSASIAVFTDFINVISFVVA